MIDLENLTRREAIELGIKVADASERGDVSALCNLLGIDDDLLETMSMDDILDAMRVRYATIAHRAGAEIKPL